MKTKALIVGIFIGVFIAIWLTLEALYLYQAMEPDTSVIGHITFAMIIICGTGIFALIAYNIKEVTQA
jgi:hypothetical protein